MKAEYIDSMGSDLTVVNAARVSHDKESQWGWREIDLGDGDYDYDTYLVEKDSKLVKHLSKYEHFTPFTHCMVTMRETVPIFVARQRFKHTVGFSYNEVSRRYVSSPPEFYKPLGWRRKADNVKQGSSTEIIEEPLYVRLGGNRTISEAYERLLEHVETLYKDMLEHGVCPEQARMVLPQSMYTSYYVTGSLAAWARAYKLRSDPHAQMEIQELAKQWDNIIEPLFPVSWKELKE